MTREKSDASVLETKRASAESRPSSPFASLALTFESHDPPSYSSRSKLPTFTIDGKPPPVNSFGRIKLHPGQTVTLGGEDFTVFRSVIAHA